MCTSTPTIFHRRSSPTPPITRHNHHTTLLPVRRQTHSRDRRSLITPKGCVRTVRRRSAAAESIPVRIRESCFFRRYIRRRNTGSGLHTHINTVGIPEYTFVITRLAGSWPIQKCYRYNPYP